MGAKIAITRSRMNYDSVRGDQLAPKIRIRALAA